MRFHIGQRVEKYTGDYTGPGIVLGVAFLDHGIVRYVVGHRLEGGTGQLLHLYSEANLREYPDPAIAAAIDNDLYHGSAGTDPLKRLK